MKYHEKHPDNRNKYQKLDNKEISDFSFFFSE